MAFNGNNVKAGAGSLYAAPLLTAEPTSISGVWTGWTPLGYTEAGSEFDFGVQTAAMLVEEEFWPIRTITTGYTGSMTFVLAETTRQNLALSFNAGIGTSTQSASQGTGADGTLWQETPVAGTEVRVMLGWDYIPAGASTSVDPACRIIVRQCLQSGTVKRLARKGNNKSTYAVQFSFEKPPGVQPVRFLFEASLAA